MARTADRYLKKRQKKVNRREFKAGNYLRLSKDSDYTGSDSLENQKKLAREYVDRFEDIVLIKEYVDDGKTGTNFSRPAFFRLIADLKEGIINCVIVKDLSRFGRDYIEAGNYIEKVFPFMNVRFISILDRYDSADPGCDKELFLISLKNLMHEMYAKDISKKIGSTYRMKHEKGAFYRSSKIPYGYKMDNSNTKYCIDENAAAIVRQIFYQYSIGKTKYAISQYLYKNKVMPPFQYYQTGRIYRNDEDEIKAWSLSTLDRMLTNPVYLGNVIRHKTEQSFSEGKAPHVVPESEQIFIKGTHEAIINEIVFNKVQERMNAVKDKYILNRSQEDAENYITMIEPDVFHGKIFCGSCKANMVRTGVYPRENRKIDPYKVYRCGRHRVLPECCDTRFIEEKELCDILYMSIQKQISLMKGFRSFLEKEEKASFERRLKSIMQEKEKLINRKLLAEQEYMRMYSQYVAGELGAVEFRRFRNVHQENMELDKKHQKGLEQEEKRIKKSISMLKKLIDEWIKFDHTSHLTQDMIEICVERIEVFQDKRIEIRFRHQDCFTLMDEWREAHADDYGTISAAF